MLLIRRQITANHRALAAAIFIDLVTSQRISIIEPREDPPPAMSPEKIPRILLGQASIIWQGNDNLSRDDARSPS